MVRVQPDEPNFAVDVGRRKVMTAFVLSNFIDWNNVWMIELRGGFRFGMKAFDFVVPG